VCQCRGIAAITKNVLHTRHLPRIKESLLATILYLINHPHTRQHFKAGVDLEVHSPFQGSYFAYSLVSKVYSIKCCLKKKLLAV